MHDFLERLLGAKQSDSFVHAGLKILIALLILLVGMWLAARLANFTQRALNRAQVDVTQSGFMRNAVYGMLIALLIVVALNQAGVSTAPLVAALGAAGLAIGLALQGSLSNLAWGVLLVIFRPFRVGDYVTAGGVEGTVEQVNLMHTLLVMPDNREAIVPNAKIGTDAIINMSRRGTRRFELKVGIGYKDDIGGAIAEIERQFAAEPRILQQPAPVVVLAGLGESSVDMLIRAWTSTADFWAVQSDLLRAIKERFDAAGISIPFPQRELTVIHGSLAPAPPKSG